MLTISTASNTVQVIRRRLGLADIHIFPLTYSTFLQAGEENKSTPVGLKPVCCPPEMLRPFLFRSSLLHLRNHRPTLIRQTRSLLDPRSPAQSLLAAAEQQIAKRLVKLAQKSMGAQKHLMATSINKITRTTTQSTSRGQDKNNQSFKMHQGTMQRWCVWNADLRSGRRLGRTLEHLQNRALLQHFGLLLGNKAVCSHLSLLLPQHRCY